MFFFWFRFFFVSLMLLSLASASNDATFIDMQKKTTAQAFSFYLYQTVSFPDPTDWTCVSPSCKSKENFWCSTAGCTILLQERFYFSTPALMLLHSPKTLRLSEPSATQFQRDRFGLRFPLSVSGVLHKMKRARTRALVQKSVINVVRWSNIYRFITMKIDTLWNVKWHFARTPDGQGKKTLLRCRL